MSSFENMLEEFGNGLINDNDDTMNVDSITEFDLPKSDYDENKNDEIVATNSGNELFGSVLMNSYDGIMEKILEDSGNGDDNDLDDKNNDGKKTEERISEYSICTQCKYGNKESIDIIVNDNIDKDLVGVGKETDENFIDKQDYYRYFKKEERINLLDGIFEDKSKSRLCVNDFKAKYEVGNMKIGDQRSGKRELILKRSSFNLIRDSKLNNSTMESKDLKKSVSEENLYSIKRRRKDNNDDNEKVLKKFLSNDDRIEINEEIKPFEYVDSLNRKENLEGNFNSIDKRIIEKESFYNNKDIESFLEISAESESIKNDKEFEIRGERIKRINSNSVPVSIISVDIDSTNDLNTFDEKENANDSMKFFDAENLSDKEIAEIDEEKDNEKENEETLKDNEKKLIKENFRIIADDFFSSQFLSESELEKIEMESLKKDKNKEKVDFEIKKIIDKNKEDIFYKPDLEIIDNEISINENVERNKLNIGKAKSITKKNDIFYKPEVNNFVSDKEIFVVPSIPNWVTNPASEPNYEMIRQTHRMRKECVRKMLNEVLRLSGIISKIGNAIKDNPEEVNSYSETGNIDKKKIVLNPVSTDLEMSFNNSTIINSVNNLGGNSKKGDVFYVPESTIIFNKRNNVKDYHQTQENVNNIYKTNIFTPLGKNSKIDNKVNERNIESNDIQNNINNKKMTIFNNDKKINLKPLVNIFYTPDEN